VPCRNIPSFAKHSENRVNARHTGRICQHIRTNDMRCSENSAGVVIVAHTLCCCFTCHSYWLAGLGLVIFGSLGDFAALSMVAQSIVAPLASTTLVTNVIFAHFWLHEHVGRRELAGTALIIIGSTLAVVFGDHNTRSYTNDDLVSLIGGGWFLAYAILVFLLCIAGLMLHRKITPIKKNLVEAIRRYEVAVEANNSQGADWEDEVIARLESEYRRWEKLHPFSLCALSGAFGAQSVLFGKVSTSSECTHDDQCNVDNRSHFAFVC
jgi:hypothetical protein